MPEQTRWVSGQLLAQLDFVSAQVKQLEQRLQELVEVTPEMQWLLTLPGVGVILAATIALEIGEVERFPSAMHLASYSGTTPRVHASGGKVRYGPLRADVNRYLKWAFAEAANSVAVNHLRCPERHVSQLYRRLRQKKGHPKAIGAVARHLAEAAFQCCAANRCIKIPVLVEVGPARCKCDFVMIPPMGSRNECDTPANNSMPLHEGEEMTRYDPFDGFLH